MAVLVKAHHPLGGGNGGWDAWEDPIAIYSTRQEAIKAIKAMGCTKFRDGRWTRDPKPGEHLSQVTGYVVGKSLPFDRPLRKRR